MKLCSHKFGGPCIYCSPCISSYPRINKCITIILIIVIRIHFSFLSDAAWRVWGTLLLLSLLSSPSILLCTFAREPTDAIVGNRHNYGRHIVHSRPYHFLWGHARDKDIKETLKNIHKHYSKENIRYASSKFPATSHLKEAMRNDAHVFLKLAGTRDVLKKAEKKREESRATANTPTISGALNTTIRSNYQPEPSNSGSIYPQPPYGKYSEQSKGLFSKQSERNGSSKEKVMSVQTPGNDSDDYAFKREKGERLQSVMKQVMKVASKEMNISNTENFESTRETTDSPYNLYNFQGGKINYNNNRLNVSSFFNNIYSSGPLRTANQTENRMQILPYFMSNDNNEKLFDSKSNHIKKSARLIKINPENSRIARHMRSVLSPILAKALNRKDYSEIELLRALEDPIALRKKILDTTVPESAAELVNIFNNSEHIPITVLLQGLDHIQPSIATDYLSNFAKTVRTSLLRVWGYTEDEIAELTNSNTNNNNSSAETDSNRQNFPNPTLLLTPGGSSTMYQQFPYPTPDDSAPSGSGPNYRHEPLQSDSTTFSYENYAPPYHISDPNLKLNDNNRKGVRNEYGPMASGGFGGPSYAKFPAPSIHSEAGNPGNDRPFLPAPRPEKRIDADESSFTDSLSEMMQVIELQ